MKTTGILTRWRQVICISHNRIWKTSFSAAQRHRMSQKEIKNSSSGGELIRWCVGETNFEERLTIVLLDCPDDLQNLPAGNDELRVIRRTDNRYSRRCTDNGRREEADIRPGQKIRTSPQQRIRRAAFLTANVMHRNSGKVFIRVKAKAENAENFSDIFSEFSKLRYRPHTYAR